MPASVVVWVVLGCNCQPFGWSSPWLSAMLSARLVSSPWLSAMEVVLGCQPCCPPGRWVVSHFDACIFVQTEHATQNATNAKTCLFLCIVVFASVVFLVACFVCANILAWWKASPSNYNTTLNIHAWWKASHSNYNTTLSVPASCLETCLDESECQGAG